MRVLRAAGLCGLAAVSGCIWDLPEPLPEGPVSPATEPVFVEAEELALDGFVVEASGIASAGAYIKTTGGNDGTATYNFPGDEGIYDVRVIYFDEADGASSMQLIVNGDVKEDWIWNEELGSDTANGDTLTSRTVVGITLEPGDAVQLVGQPDGDEPLRTDRLEFLVPGS